MSCIVIVIMQSDLETSDDLWLLCTENGLIWEPEGSKGGIFMFLHTFVMISAAL